MPDGRISQVRFEALACRWRAFPFALRFKRWFAYAPAANGLLTASSLALAAVWCARFYQAEPAPVVGTTKCPESLCLMLALPPSGRRVPPPARTLLLGHSLYRLIRQTRVALLSFGSPPRSRSLCRLLPAPAATGSFPTLSLRIFPEMPEPMPRRSAECICLVLPQLHRPSPSFDWVGFPRRSANTIFHGSAFEAAAIS